MTKAITPMQSGLPGPPAPPPQAGKNPSIDKYRSPVS